MPPHPSERNPVLYFKELNKNLTSPSVRRKNLVGIAFDFSLALPSLHVVSNIPSSKWIEHNRLCLVGTKSGLIICTFPDHKSCCSLCFSGLGNL